MPGGHFSIAHQSHSDRARYLRRGMPISPRVSCAATVLPRNRTKSAKNEGVAPPYGVASSWVLHFHGVASGGYPCFSGTLALRVSLCSLLVGAFPLLCALGRSLSAPSLFAPLP